MLRTLLLALFILSLLAGCSNETPAPATGGGAGATTITVYKSPT